MAQGSWLMAKGRRPSPGAPGHIGPGPGPGCAPPVPGAGPAPLGMSHEQCAMSHEPLIGGWGVLNREIVSLRSCGRTRGLVA